METTIWKSTFWHPNRSMDGFGALRWLDESRGRTAEGPGHRLPLLDSTWPSLGRIGEPWTRAKFERSPSENRWTQSLNRSPSDRVDLHKISPFFKLPSHQTIEKHNETRTKWNHLDCLILSALLSETNAPKAKLLKEAGWWCINSLDICGLSGIIQKKHHKPGWKVYMCISIYYSTSCFVSFKPTWNGDLRLSDVWQ